MAIKNEENEITKEVLCYLHDLIVNNLKKISIAEDEAESMAVSILENIVRDFRREFIYIPSCTIEAAHEKWNEIFDLWEKGETVKDLSRAYSFSVVHIYNIIKTIKEKRRAKRQGSYWQH